MTGASLYSKEQFYFRQYKYIEVTNLLLYMYIIRLPVATRQAIAHRVGHQHHNIKGVCVAILAAVPRGKLYQMFNTV